MLLGNWNIGADQVLSMTWTVGVFIGLGVLIMWGVAQMYAFKETPSARLQPLRRPTGPVPALAAPPIASQVSMQRTHAMTVQLPGGTLIARPGERRFSVRWGDKPVPVQVAHGMATDKTVEGTVVNLSRTGVALVVPEQVAAGSTLSICNTKYPDCPTWIPLKVKYCRRKNNQWQAGCQFLHPQPWNVLMLLS